MPGRAVIVHSLAMARAALACGPAVLLLSAEGAAGYAGVGWWRALMRAAGAAEGTHMLDCGALPGCVLEALLAGQKLLVLRSEPRIFTDLSERALDCGACLLAGPPAALDLGVRGAERLLAQWVEAK